MLLQAPNEKPQGPVIVISILYIFKVILKLFIFNSTNVAYKDPSMMATVMESFLVSTCGRMRQGGLDTLCTQFLLELLSLCWSSHLRLRSIICIYLFLDRIPPFITMIVIFLVFYTLNVCQGETL